MTESRLLCTMRCLPCTPKCFCLPERSPCAASSLALNVPHLIVPGSKLQNCSDGQGCTEDSCQRSGVRSGGASRNTSCGRGCNRRANSRCTSSIGKSHRGDYGDTRRVGVCDWARARARTHRACYTGTASVCGTCSAAYSEGRSASRNSAVSLLEPS